MSDSHVSLTVQENETAIQAALAAGANQLAVLEASGTEQQREAALAGEEEAEALLSEMAELRREAEAAVEAGGASLGRMGPCLLKRANHRLQKIEHQIQRVMRSLGENAGP